jgi:hypothetical protein
VFCAGTSNAPEAALVSAIVVCPWWGFLFILSLKGDNHTISHINDKCKKSSSNDKNNISFKADNWGEPTPAI